MICNMRMYCIAQNAVYSHLLIISELFVKTKIKHCLKYVYNNIRIIVCLDIWVLCCYKYTVAPRVGAWIETCFYGYRQIDKTNVVGFFFPSLRKK